MQQFTQLQICNNSHNYKYATIKEANMQQSIFNMTNEYTV